jgi:prolyl-tRNA editing enzyme YbaK/EbsC (Cys-tRNA(Pro) deacylase)
MDYHPVVHQIRTLLIHEGCWFETFEHEPVRTSAEAATVRTGYTIDQGAKALIVRAKHPERGKHFVMFVLSGSARFDNARVKALFGFTDLRFATEMEVADITGDVKPGGVPPLGMLFGLPVYVEEALLAHEKIVFNAGDRRFSVAMLTSDFERLTRPTRGHFITAA